MQRKQRPQIRLLLLGAGESGKSTVVKQMELVYRKGFDSEQRHYYRIVIRHNLLESIESMVKAMSTLSIQYEKEQSFEGYNRLIDPLMDIDQEVDIELGPAEVKCIDELWTDAGIQKCYTRSNEYQLLDSTSYFIEAIGRLSQPNYVPTDQDILHSRVVTKSIVETKFYHGKNEYLVIDVGGQRGERRKWIGAFEGVTAIIFVTAASAYDQCLQEDGTRNRTTESLQLFESICNSPWFRHTSIILFLNKVDIFVNKFKGASLIKVFPKFKDWKNERDPEMEEVYEGRDDPARGLDFIAEQFGKVCKHPEKTIYLHHTCVLDTEAFQVLFVAVADIVIKLNLKFCGLM